jgi:hypothetical protein
MDVWPCVAGVVDGVQPLLSETLRSDVLGGPSPRCRDKDHASAPLRDVATALLRAADALSALSVASSAVVLRAQVLALPVILPTACLTDFFTSAAAHLIARFRHLMAGTHRRGPRA